MEVKEAIANRRAYRSLEKVDITSSLVTKLAESAALAPSCFNNQPWRFVFVYEEEQLEKLHQALSKGNEWAQDASMIIAVTSKRDFDCKIKGRDYYLFDVGLATANLILKATEMGLVAHPIAGYNEDQVKPALKIPQDMTVITLVMVGKHTEAISPKLSEKQVKDELRRPKRFALEQIAYHNSYPQDKTPLF